MQTIKTLSKVFTNIKYSSVALFTSVLIFVITTLLPNFQLLKIVFRNDSILLSKKISILFSLLGSIGTNFTTFGAMYTIIISILFGVYVSLLIYFIKNRLAEVSKSGVATGFFGVLSGAIGVGCAACGTFIFGSLLSVSSLAWIVKYLPLDGGEFGIIGIVLLVISIYLTTKKISQPAVCGI